jgi:predicted CopG family antitoxin
MPQSSRTRKERKTFSLSTESVSYLESLRKARKGKSISSVLEELIRQRREAEEMRRISASISSYYDSLTDEEMAENDAWGQFAETQFAAEN